MRKSMVFEYPFIVLRPILPVKIRKICCLLIISFVLSGHGVNAQPVNPYERYLTYATYAVVAVLMLITGLIVWNRLLSKAVLLRTAALAESEQRLRRSEDRVRLIINTIPIMAWTTEPNGVVDFLNQPWIDYTGLSLKHYANNPIGPIHPDDIARATEKWQQKMKAEESYEVEMRLQAADGSYRWFLVRTAPLHDKQGNLVKWYGVSIDIENSKELNEKLRRLSSHLQNIQENERTSIAREIHDELGQLLTGLKMEVGWLNKKLPDDTVLKDKGNEILSLVSQTLKTVKRIAMDLRPNILDELGLVAALEWQGQEFEKARGIKFQFLTNIQEFDPGRTLSTNVFRVHQEALTNIARHAQATCIETTLEKKDSLLLLTIKDNGNGFNVEEEKSINSIGLIGMKERALMLHGALTIKSENQKGTVITLSVPLIKPEKK
jgi:PAS domain S-box-containing protein